MRDGALYTPPGMGQETGRETGHVGGHVGGRRDGAVVGHVSGPGPGPGFASDIAAGSGRGSADHRAQAGHGSGSAAEAGSAYGDGPGLGPDVAVADDRSAAFGQAAVDAVPARTRRDDPAPGQDDPPDHAPAELDHLAAYDRLMPFHVLVGPDGCIEHCGPTLDRIAGPGRLKGRAFLSAFDLRRPREATSFAALGRPGGAPVRLVLRDGIHLPMRGLTVPLPAGRTLVNLTFGIAMVEAVARYRLTADDFAPTDLAVEMLYLVEAQSAALHESRKLNGRLQGAKIAAEEQAFTDTLTGLKNRRAMTHVVERLFTARAEFALMLLDLDFFKDVNDTLGHAAGDHVLQTVARILLDEARPGDTVVRLGGDEFALIAPGLHEGDAALSLARRIVQRIEVPILVGTERCRISASIGIAISTGWPAGGIADLLTRADAMLYAVKGAGRGDAAVAPQVEAAVPTPGAVVPGHSPEPVQEHAATGSGDPPADHPDDVPRTGPIAALPDPTAAPAPSDRRSA